MAASHVLSSIIALLALAPAAADCPCTLSAVNAELSALTNGIASLQQLGVDTQYEQISSFSASYFITAISSDSVNLNTSVLMACGGYLGCNVTTSPACRTAAATCATAMLCNETCGLLQALTSANEGVVQVLAAPSTRVATRLIRANATTVTGSSGYFRDAAGTPTLLGGMNWFPDHSVDLNTAISYVQKFSVSTMDVTLSPAAFLPNATGGISQQALGAMISDLNFAQAWGMRVQIYVDHEHLPAWAPAMFPGLTDRAAVGKSHFVGYDIDNPGFQYIYGTVLSQVAAGIKSHPTPFAFLLANEPMFPTAASNYSLNGYITWLTAAYRDNIASLNTAWGSQFKSFNDVGASHLAPQQGAVSPAEWYDWCMFNQARVTAWLQFMVDSIASTAPATLTEAKFLNENLMTFATVHNDGIDREAALRMLDLSGCDTRLPVPAVAAPGSSARSQYAISWLSTAVSYDFSRSIVPDKGIYDSEWHDVTDDGFYTPALPAAHVTVGLWLAHMHGMAANQMWYWGRTVNTNATINADGGAAGFFVWSLLTQPQLLDAYSRTLVQLNTFAAVVTPFARMSRRVVLLYSEASAIQSQLFRNAMISTYEALYFLGNGIGFATDASLSSNCTLSASDVSNTTIIIPNSNHVLDATVTCLAAFAASGGNVIVVGNRTFTTGGDTLSMTAHGKPRNPSALTWLNTTATVSFLPVPGDASTTGVDPVQLMPELEAALSPTPAGSAHAPARCMAAGKNSHAYGVMCRAIACTPAGGPVVDGVPPSTLTPPPFACNATMFIVNVMDAPVDVDLQVLHGGNGVVPADMAYSVLNNSMLVRTSGITLQPLEYVLLLV